MLSTQVGYPSCQHCGKKSTFKYKTVDEQCQTNAYQGIISALMAPAARSIVAGLYFWNWLPCTNASAQCRLGPLDNGESPQQKLAQGVLSAAYAH